MSSAFVRLGVVNLGVVILGVINCPVQDLQVSIEFP